VTNPGDIERIATKVVPYVVVGVVEDETETPTPSQEEAEATSQPVVERRRPTWLGFLAAGLGIATLVLFIIAMIVSTGGDAAAGTVLSYATIVTSFSAVITALISLVLGYRRRWAAYGFALGVLANPLLLVTVFRLFEG